MNQQDKPSLLEKISGSLVTETALTGLAAYIGTPLAALLPVLNGSLASSRHAKRIENSLCEITEKLQEYEDKIKNISDSKYKLIN